MTSEADRGTLLRLARQAVTLAADGNPLPPLDTRDLPTTLRAPGCAFVTLMIDGLLRGCIGGLERVFPLAEDVWRHAYAAASEDARFAPVRPEELPSTRIEVSTLGAPRRLAVPADRLALALRPGVDGVILRQGQRRATFLPQVWAKVPQAEAFLDLLADKAGLPRSAWRSGEAEVFVYQVESFEET